VSRRRGEISAVDVIAGRIRPDLDTLVELIHATNPTERGLPPAVEARRYTEKSALQSLLITDHAERVRVVAHGGPGVVSLRLSSGRDAGHARLDTLTPEARAWVQQALDLAGLPDAAAPGRVVLDSGPESDDPLALGQAALARYDFEAAEAWLQAALTAAPADAAPVVALLELWVDHLAADAQAVALGAVTLPADTRIRGLLAVAAARSGHQKSALRWLEGLEGPRAGEAWGWLARAALQAEDLPAARRAVAALERVWPGAVALGGLRDEVAVLAARLRAPAEAALQGVEITEEIEVRARHLLEAHPDSAVAARVLRAAAERRQAERQEQLVTRAAAEDAAGRFGAAATLYREALALGAPVGAALQAASARAEADRRAARVLAVAERLEEPDEAALLAWLALEPTERALVDVARPELVWLSQLQAPSSGAAAKEAVRAVRALAQARPLATEAPATALALVEPHRARLAGLSDALHLLALADEAVHLGRAARQRGLIEAAAALLRAGDRAAAQARLDAVVTDALAEADLDRLLALRRQAELLDALASAQTAEERRPLLAELAGLDAHDEKSERRRGAARKAADTSRFASRLSALDEVIARAWHRRVFRDVTTPPAVLFTPGTRTDPRIWLTPDGQVVVPDLRGPWLILRWMSAPSLPSGEAPRTQRAVRWRLPRPTRLMDFVVEAKRLRLLTEDREVITFSADGATLLRCDTLPGGRIEAGLLVPESDHAWLAERGTLEVFAVAARTRLRTLTGTLAGTLGGLDDPQVVVRGERTTLHAAGGLRLRDLGHAEGAISGAGGEVVLVGDHQAADCQGLHPGQAAGTRAGATFQLRLGHLWAGDLDWSLHVAPDAELLRDARDTQVCVLVPDLGGLQLRVLTAESAPSLHLSPMNRPGPELQPWRTRFAAFPVERLPAVLATQEALRHTPVATWLATHRPTQGPWADALCHEALRRLDPGAAAAVLETARRAWPQSGLIGLTEAEPAAEAALWSRARAALEGRVPEPEVALRFFRLLGFARLQTGAPEAALEAWRTAVAIAPDEAWHQDGLIAAVAPALDDGPAPPSVYAACMRALRTAERCRLAGDLAGVIQALDHPCTWHFAELQSLARLTEALLEDETHNPSELLRKHHVLALFAEAADGSLDLGPERRVVLPLAADRWSAARMETLAERARRWLDEH